MKNRGAIVATTALLVVVILIAMAHSDISRLTTYRSLKRKIEAGDEVGALRELRRVSGKRWFRPDWTPGTAMPTWRWLHELDMRAFGCPSCRGIDITLLQYATARGQTRLATALMNAGGSIVRWGDGESGLLINATASGNTNMMALVLSRGASINATNYTGAAVIHLAGVLCQKPEVTEYLLREGADVNLEDIRGWTPLDWASVWNKNAVPLLLRYGAIAGTNRRVALPK